MDNWGDPWADNAKSPIKNTVTSPLPPTFAPAPALFNGFLDDAGWGNEDESFGDWSAATVNEVVDAPRTEAIAIEPSTTQHIDQSSSDSQWNTEERLYKVAVPDEVNWADAKLDAPEDEELVLSETSDTSTTVQAYDTVGAALSNDSGQLPADDDSSARLSTSPSEHSRNDNPLESPRTSYEEEKAAAKATREEEDKILPNGLGLARTGAERSRPASSGRDVAEEVVGDIMNKVEDEDDLVTVYNDLGHSHEVLETADSPIEVTSIPSVTGEAHASSSFGTFTVDPELLRGLFPPYKETEELLEAQDDPIYSTSGRKAWYRLTRKQTLREFNNGNDDDNYIRVTWANSHIRSEVNKIVGRWAREDRVSGTGPGARASFYWDSPAPVEQVMTGAHMRQRSSIATTGTGPPTRESIPVLSTDTPTAFNWSSTSASNDPWQQLSPGLRSTSSPIAPIHPTVIKAQQQGARAVSLDLTSHTPEPAKHARDLPITDETPAVTHLISPPFTNTTASPPDPWSGLDKLDAPSAPHVDLLTAPVDDEDEWGEMVSSPTVSTFATTDLSSQVDTRNNTLSTVSTTPQSRRSAVIQDQSPNAMHAASIVRLRSTISPTSATFKGHIFLPLGAEQGPIGPGILKPAKRSVSVTPKKVGEKQPTPAKELVVPVASKEPPKLDIPNDFATSQTPVPDSVPQAKPAEEASTILTPTTKQEAPRPSTPPAPTAPPAQPNIDAWADADFSFFESSLPAAPPSEPKPDPSDPFSAFESRARSVSVASSAKTFTRSPPRKVSPPPVQPLTSATSAAQRRKTEEEQIVRDILAGLPDLRYMLL